MKASPSTLVHILHIIEALSRGGAERQLMDMVCRMNRSRFVSTVCHLYERDDSKSELTAAGVNVVGLQLKSRRDGVKAIARLCRLLREGNFSVVHTWLDDADIFGRLAGRLTRVPLVVSSLHTHLAGRVRQTSMSIASTALPTRKSKSSRKERDE